MKRIRNILPGLSLTFIVAVLSFYLSEWLPFGAVVIGITLGMIFGNLFKLPNRCLIGISFAEKQILA